MKNQFASIVGIFTLSFSLMALAAPASRSVYDLKVKNIDGKEIALNQFKGKVVMIVNTASNCGFTPQYNGLESLYQKYKDKGFVVLAFPSNDFGGQEPGTDQEIKKFCDAKEGKYKVSFPLFSKTVVKNENKSELYKILTETAQPAGEVGWNFEKFLVNKDGKVVGRFKSKVKPEDPEIAKQIETLL